MEPHPEPAAARSIDPQRSQALSPQFWRRAIAWLVLAVGLLGTWWAWRLASRQADGLANERFRVRCERIHDEIQSRMLAYDQVLKGAAGLYAASVDVQRGEWRAYVLGLGIEGHYPGIHGLGFIEYVPDNNRDTFLGDARKDLPGAARNAFRIKPDGRREVYLVVKYVEPIERNQPALGYDIGVESNRLHAAETARDAGEAVLTGPLRLVQSASDTPGILLLRPIYHNGHATNDVAQRQRAIQGWVYAAFQMNELMDQALRDDSPEVDFEIYDGDAAPTPEALLYDRDRRREAGAATAEGVFATRSKLSFARRTWSLHFRTQPQYEAGEPWNKPQFLGLAGLCISLLLFGVIHALASTQARAQALARDITRTLQVQEQAMSSSSNSITILDARPGLSIIYANPAVAQMTGYTPEELTGQDGSILLGPEPNQPGVAKLREAVRKGEECRAVLHCYRKDGTPFWNEINLSPVRARSGAVTHFVSVSTDITHRLEFERHLEAARAAAEAASRAKSEFLANISHEIRTPLNAVLGLTELVLDAPLNEEQRRLLAASHQSANELAALVNDVLDFSRIEAGKLELRPEAFQLRPMLERCLAAFAPRAREKGLALNLHVAHQVPEVLLADVLRLRQVLVNLISNAVKFTARGEVSVEVRPAGAQAGAGTSGLAPQPGATKLTQLPLPLAPPAAAAPEKAEATMDLEFIVTDTGIGIAPAKHQAIFEAFTQADNSITRLYGGTGLGLAISKRLVALLGGRIWVISEPDRGAAFHFTARFQVADAQAVSIPEPRPAPVTPGFRVPRPLRVLVVEDNPVNALLVTTLLERLGHSVTQAASGQDAVALATRGDVDLVLMDLQMPGLDGLQATARIRDHEREQGGHLPILAITAHALPQDREQCLAAGMDDYLAKPIQRAELFAAIDRVLPGAAPAAAAAAQGSALRGRLLQELNGDVRTLERLVALFLETTPALLRELSEAAAARDLPRLMRSAHTLKGSLMQMGGESGRAAALKVETAAAAGDLEAALVALPALEQEATRLSDELASGTVIGSVASHRWNQRGEG